MVEGLAVALRKRPRKWTNSLVKVACWAIATVNGENGQIGAIVDVRFVVRTGMPRRSSTGRL